MSMVLPPEIEQFVEQEVATGAYSSRDELIIAAVQLLRQRQADLSRLRADIAKGLEDEGVPAEEVFAQLRPQFMREKSNMSTANDLYSQALCLSADQRGELAYLLLESLPEEERPIELDPEYETELLRRLEEIDSGQAKMLTVDQVMMRLRRP
jgi:antitoxin ParD1/3/4